MTKELTLAIQKSGRLSDGSLKLLRESGFDIRTSNRALITQANNFPLKILFVRAKNIPELVKDGVADIGICGFDTFIEKNISTLEIVEKIGFARCRMALAAREALDLNGKKIATTFPVILQQYLSEKNLQAKIIPFEGSVEITPNIGLADAICDIVSTGSTLKMNGLIELDTVFESEAVLIGLKDMPIATAVLLQNFLIRLRSTLQAQKTKYIVMNAPRESLSKIQSLVPGMKSPTVTELANPDFLSISSVVSEDDFWETIQQLKSFGAADILVMPIEKIIR
jgi:ATP phosphoribosyltransferase